MKRSQPMPSEVAVRPNLTRQVVCKVAQMSGRPMLFLPDRAKDPKIPFGWVKVIVDGEVYQANFVKIAVNVIKREGEANALPAILRKWFGPAAGMPGTKFHVVFDQSADGYVLAPKGE
jgi:hypothetical protein